MVKSSQVKPSRNGWENRAEQIYEGFPGVNTLTKQSYLLLIILLIAFALAFTITYTLEIISIDIVFWLFFVLGVGTLPVGLGLTVYQFLCYNSVKQYFEDKNLDRNSVDFYLGKYFSSLPKQIMNLGVIPLILGIISIILEEYQPAIVIINGTVVNIVTILMLVGAFSEAVAFLFGFLFPEPDGYNFNPRHSFDETGQLTANQITTQSLPKTDSDGGRNSLTKDELREVLKDITGNITIGFESK